MTRFRKWMILIHRWLGVALSILFVVWFISGIAMIYARGMPSLTPQMRLEHLPPLDLARVRLTASEAAKQNTSQRLVLLMVMDRPAYRIGAVTLFADTGEVLKDVSAAEAVTITARFMKLPERALHHVSRIEEADQWTITSRRQRPFHKISVDDDARTQLYVSESLGEVTVLTTRSSRALAWIAAIPHWLYFAPLRLNDALWRQVILWTSGLGSLLALIGLVVGVIQFSPSRPHIPYAGWMRWHYITGAIFGLFTLTWVFSGMLSMEPWFWASGGGLHVERQALNLSLFPAIRTFTGNAKEIEFVQIEGNPYYVVRGAESKPQLVAANSLQVRREPFPIESLITPIKSAHPGVAITESALLNDYDSYYYARGEARPLPVFRVKFDDPEKTWFYLDPSMGQIVARFHRRARIERWLYHGFHSLDFGVWYYNRPAWDIGMIALSIGGIISSAIGLFIGMKRLLRKVRQVHI